MTDAVVALDGQHRSNVFEMASAFDMRAGGQHALQSNKGNG
jgi:hypothetical protein